MAMCRHKKKNKKTFQKNVFFNVKLTFFKTTQKTQKKKHFRKTFLENVKLTFFKTIFKLHM